MYLVKSANGIYFSRICSPKPLLPYGYPYEIKVSLMTKDRHVAIQRNFEIAACIKQAFTAVQSFRPIPFEDFKRALDARIKRIREESFFIPPKHSPAAVQLEDDFNLMPQSIFEPMDEFQLEDNLPNEFIKDSVHESIPYRSYLKLFIDSKRASQISELTCHQLQQRINHFIYYVEKNDIQEVKTADVMRYIDVLNAEGRSAKTNKDYFASTKQFFKWLKLMGYLAANPATDVCVKFRSKKHASEERDRWAEEELRQMFRHHLYQKQNEDFHWVTLLQLYHGLRPNEACQLHTESVRFKNGVHYLHLTDQAPKTHLKNAQAVRDVPIHQYLIDQGFLKFLSSRESRRNRPIFNYRPLGKDNDWSKSYRNSMGKMQTKLGMKPRNRPTAYSLRHTFIDVLKEAEVLEHEVAELVGHVNPNMTFGRYGKKLNLLKLHKIVNTFSIDWENA